MITLNFLGWKRRLKTKVRLRDVTIPHMAMHLIKLFAKNNFGVYVYPFAGHDRVAVKTFIDIVGDRRC